MPLSSVNIIAEIVNHSETLRERQVINLNPYPQDGFPHIVVCCTHLIDTVGYKSMDLTVLSVHACG